MGKKCIDVKAKSICMDFDIGLYCILLSIIPKYLGCMLVFINRNASNSVHIQATHTAQVGHC